MYWDVLEQNREALIKHTYRRGYIQLRVCDNSALGMGKRVGNQHEERSKNNLGARVSEVRRQEACKEKQGKTQTAFGNTTDHQGNIHIQFGIFVVSAEQLEDLV